MLKNYFKTAFRNLFRNKSFSLINILGLAAGMAICMLIITITNDLKSYDRFHDKKDRIYRVISDRTGRSPSSFATSPLVLHDILTDQAAAIEQALRIKANFGGDARFEETILPISGLFAEYNFFEFFDFEMVYGNSSRALTDPYSIVLTEEAAEKFGFGGQNPVGKSIEVGELGTFQITGVVKNPPSLKTHLQFESLVSFSTVKPLEEQELINRSLTDWAFTDNGFNYLLLHENANPSALQPLFSKLSDERYASMNNYRLDFRLQKLTQITPAHLIENDISFSLPKVFLYFLAILAMIVMLTACFNYTNLSVARALTRAKEVGVRKIVGARRSHLFMQFICEAVLIALFALVFAWVLLEAVVAPQFEHLSVNQFLNLEIKGSGPLYIQFLVFSLGIGLLAGFLPAVYLSRFQPARVLKSLTNVKVFAGLGWRKALLMLQFVISLVLIISVTVLYQQTNHMLHADYGFDRQNIINLSLQGQDIETIKSEFGELSDIIEISACSIIPGIGSNQATRIALPDATTDDDRFTHQIFVDDRFIDNLKLTVVAGKKLEQTTSNNQVMINQTGARILGWENPIDAIGEAFILDGAIDDGGQLVQVVGILEDFPYMGVLRQPESLVLRTNSDGLRYANLTIQSDDISETLDFVEDKWAKLDPVHPVQYSFFDDQVGTAVAVYRDLLKLLGFLAALAIIITCLGLLGIAAYSVETRVKEIGIRKVLGASVSRIIWILSKGLFYPLLVAILVALPVAWYLNSLWLQEVAIRISLTVANMGFGIVLIAALGAVILVSQSWRIARRNPVEALKYE